MSADKYPGIFSCQMEAIVYLAAGEARAVAIHQGSSSNLTRVVRKADNAIHRINHISIY